MSQSSDPTPQDPPIFKHLHARDRSILLQAHKLREEEEAKAKAAIMSADEQTSVNHSQALQGIELTRPNSFIAIKPDGVQVCLTTITRFELLKFCPARTHG